MVGVVSGSSFGKFLDDVGSKMELSELSSAMLEHRRGKMTYQELEMHRRTQKKRLKRGIERFRGVATDASERD